MVAPPFTPPPGLAGLELADEKIEFLREHVIPTDSHLLIVEGLRDDDRPTFRPTFRPEEHQGTPFAKHEVKDVQYMTLLCTGRSDDRGVISADGAWEDRIEAQSEAAQERRRSGSNTPAKKGPVKKIGLSAYTAAKKNPKPSPKAGPIEYDGSSTHSIVSDGFSAPMSRGPSFEGMGVHCGFVSSVSGAEKLETKKLKRDLHEISAKLDMTDKHAGRSGSFNEHQSKSRNHDNKSPPSNEQYSYHIPTKHQMSPHEHSSVHLPVPRFPNTSKHMTSDFRPSKRSSESTDTNLEKRAKDDSKNTTSRGQKSFSLGPETKNSKLKHSGESNPASQARKTTPLKKIDTKAQSSSEKPLRLPPLLSPLPADLDHGPPLHSSKPVASANSHKSSSKISSPNANLKDHAAAPLPDISPSLTSPRPSFGAKDGSNVFVFPPLLSPSLPDIVEQELERLHQKTLNDEKTTPTPKAASLNSVEARHEKVRRPDAPGVARKTLAIQRNGTPKLGHPPKKLASITSQKETSIILRIKLKNHIPELQKIHKLEALARLARRAQQAGAYASDAESQAESYQNGGHTGRGNKLTHRRDYDSESDTPGSKLKHATSTSISRKRPGDIHEQSSEPVQKRAKLDSEVAKPRTTLDSPFKSPSGASSNQHNLLATPKKLNNMKSLAMSRVGSSDGQARTPQNNTTSTPASADKLRINGDTAPSTQQPHPEHEKLSSEIKHYIELALGCKRQMDSILQAKARAPPTSIPEKDRKLGILIGLESILNYMQSWSSSDKLARKRLAGNWEGGVGLWNYLERASTDLPIYRNLCAQVGAQLKQELHRAYTESLGAQLQNLHPQTVDKMVRNSREVDRLYIEAEKTRYVLGDGALVLGPGLDVKRSVSLAFKAFEKFSGMDKLGWKRA